MSYVTRAQMLMHKPHTSSGLDQKLYIG